MFSHVDTLDTVQCANNERSARNCHSDKVCCSNNSILCTSRERTVQILAPTSYLVMVKVRIAIVPVLYSPR